MRLAIVSTMVVFVALLFLRASDLWVRRAQILETSEGRVTNLAVILSEYLREAFSANDAALRQLAIHSTRIGGPAASHDVWMPVLTSAKAGLTGAGTLSVTDATGTIRHSTLRQIVGQSRRDEYVFRQLASAASDDLVVDTPYPTVADPRSFVIPLGRRLTKADGSFDGMVVATFLPAEARGFFQTLDVGREGNVWVFHPDGIVVFHEPAAASDTGKVATTNPLFNRAGQRNEDGILRSALTPGGPLFISAIRPLTISPLIVAVSVSQDEVLRDWQSDVIGSVGAFVVLGLLAGVALFTLDRQTAARAEAERRHRIAEERMRFALEAARVGTWEVDLTTGATHWSEGLEVIHGIPSGTFAGTFEAFMERIHPEDRQEVRQAIEQATRLHTDSNTLYRTQWPDGSLHWIRGTGRTFYDAEGTPRRASGVGFDVTELRTLEEQYRQSQKMEAIGQLSGGVAHDFNNLLTAIQGYCELVADSLGPTSPHLASIHEIRRAADHAASLTKQLLAFSRRQMLQPRVIDLRESVRSIEPMLRRLIGEDIELVVRTIGEVGRVRADPGQIEQVIVNLAVNARDAMPNGGKLLFEVADVVLSDSYARDHLGTTPGRYVSLAASDTGVGMDSATRARIFEPFFTTKQKGKGTGLGLATVYGIVKQSGGNIWVYSEPGHGSTFKVYLPRVDDPLDQGETQPEPRSLRGSETILVVEDDETVGMLVRKVLERQGYRVLVAATPDEAVSLSDNETEHIDLLISDVVMPHLSGPALAERLLAKRERMRVLYMSGYTDSGIVHGGVLDEQTPFLQKPFTPNALAGKVREVLDRVS